MQRTAKFRHIYCLLLCYTSRAACNLKLFKEAKMTEIAALTGMVAFLGLVSLILLRLMTSLYLQFDPQAFPHGFAILDLCSFQVGVCGNQKVSQWKNP